MIKTWYELVSDAREAKITVKEKGMQLWHVGYGLPLDAIKTGSIYGWSCAYKLSDGEVQQLVDALQKNSSLERLNLSQAGIEWLQPAQNQSRSGAVLVDAIANSLTVLGGLSVLVLNETTQFEMQIAKLRKRNSEALKAMAAVPFFSKNGARREEVHIMQRTCGSNPYMHMYAALAVVEWACKPRPLGGAGQLTFLPLLCACAATCSWTALCFDSTGTKYSPKVEVCIHTKARLRLHTPWSKSCTMTQRKVS